MLVGAVIVGFGTSAPELLVSGIAAINGDLDLGVGNIVGSNVANLSLVLGLGCPSSCRFSCHETGADPRGTSVAAVGPAVRLPGPCHGLTRWEGVVLLVALTSSASAGLIAGGVGEAAEARTGTSPQAGTSTRDAARGLVDVNDAADPATGAACGAVGNGAANDATTAHGACTQGGSILIGGRCIDTTAGTTPANVPGEGADRDEVAAMVSVAHGPVLATSWPSPSPDSSAPSSGLSSWYGGRRGWPVPPA